jgi:two-component system, response regulator YesN
MYRVLVVDDEEIITNSLVHLLQTNMEDMLDVYTAYSGAQAIGYLHRAGFDIVITDIEMPGMDGIELLKQVHSLYANCRVIFLSGHDDFQYAYQALQYNAARYVLKTEHDEVLLGAVRDCIRDIQNDAHRETALRLANEQISRCLPILRREFLSRLLNGPLPADDWLQSGFVHYDMRLNLNLLVVLLAGRLDDSEDIALPLAVDLVLRESLGSEVVCECCEAKPSFILWLIQGTCEHEETPVIVRGAVEGIQRACERTLSASVSFVLDTMPVPWDKLRAKAEEMKQAMVCMLANQEKKAFAYLKHFERDDAENREQSERDLLDGVRSALLSCSAKTLDLCQEQFSRLCTRRENVPGTDVFWGLLNAALLSFVDEHGLYDSLRDDGLFHAFMFQPLAGTDAQRTERFLSLARKALGQWEACQKTKAEALLQTVDDYIRRHLSEDLSLVALSEHVYLNPSYLSRRYKELSGQNLSTAIMQARMDGAMQMLKEDGVKIWEIAEQVGYLSTTHFIRVFKKATGFTPQEWRDRQLGRNK